VGVVADGKYAELDEEQHPAFYYALSQHDQPVYNLVARTKGDPRLWIEPLSRAVRNSGLAMLGPPLTYARWVDFSLIGERYIAAGVSALSGLGLLLAVMGLFGAVSYSVSERKKELGIRVALGALPWQLLQLVLCRTLVVAGTGIALGMSLGVGATILLRSQFYGIATVEWAVLVPVGGAMLGISVLVAYLCARTWITIDPMAAVRHA
jgi:hypothetical protein